MAATAKKKSKPAPKISVRDTLAAEAMQGLLSSRAQQPLPKIMAETVIMSAMTYVIADQMIEMRTKNSAQLKQFITLQLNILKEAGTTSASGK